MKYYDLQSINDINSKRIYIFGATMWGSVLSYYLKKRGHEIFIVDNDKNKQNTLIANEIMCISPELIDIQYVCIISLRKLSNRLEVEKQLIKLGCKKIYYIDEKIEELFNSIEDEEYIKYLWYSAMGYSINLKNPLTYDEKIQWLKLYDQNPLYTRLVDKYEVKKYVSEKIGEKYVTPTIAVWDSVEDINLTNLPKCFVIKCTHDSGSTIIVKDSNRVDWELIKKELKEKLYNNFYYWGREWAYKNVIPRVLVEEYYDRNNSEETNESILIDYKVHTFNGVPKFIQVIMDRNIKEHTANQIFYDMDWNRLEWGFEEYPMSDEEVERPKNLLELSELASALASETRYSRIDFYIIDGKIKFGEITLYPQGGFHYYKKTWNRERDLWVGSQIRLEK